MAGRCTSGSGSFSFKGLRRGFPQQLNLRWERSIGASQALYGQYFRGPNG